MPKSGQYWNLSGLLKILSGGFSGGLGYKVRFYVLFIE